MAERTHEPEEGGVISDGTGDDWPFYGREREIADLEMFLSQRRFGAYVVHGRRGVGKTRLMEEAAARHLAAGGRPTVIRELPDRPDGSDRALDDLWNATVKAGQGDAFDDLRERQSHDHPAAWFATVVRHLLRKRINVVLDEFHHAAEGLDVYIKQVIDEFHHIARDPGTGALVVMGSHQQKLHAMLERSKPLNGRFDDAVSLKPWPVATVFGMAEDRGLLDHPDRFLALWTAFGGMPDQWRRFDTQSRFEALRNFDFWHDGRDWRKAFMEAQRDWLRQHPEDRFDNVAYVELKKEHRQALWILNGSGRDGLDHETFRQRLKALAGATDIDERIDETLNVLVDDLGLVEGQDEYRGTGRLFRWVVKDPWVRFQIDVLRVDPRKGVRPGRGNRPVPAVPDPPETPSSESDPVDRLEMAEGFALERLVAKVLAETPGIHRALSGVSRFSDADGRPVKDRAEVELDLLVEPGPDSGLPLVAGTCERHWRKLRETDLDRTLERLLAWLPADRTTEWLKSLPRRRLLVAVEIPEAEREGLESRGKGAGGPYECMDVLDLASLAWDLEARERARNAAADLDRAKGKVRSLWAWHQASLKTLDRIEARHPDDSSALRRARETARLKERRLRLARTEEERAKEQVEATEAAIADTDARAKRVIADIRENMETFRTAVGKEGDPPSPS